MGFILIKRACDDLYYNITYPVQLSKHSAQLTLQDEDIFKKDMPFTSGCLGVKWTVEKSTAKEEKLLQLGSAHVKD